MSLFWAGVDPKVTLPIEIYNLAFQSNNLCTTRRRQPESEAPLLSVVAQQQARGQLGGGEMTRARRPPTRVAQGNYACAYRIVLMQMCWDVC
jgi:hypothetical protein